MPLPPRRDASRFRFVLPPSIGDGAARTRGVMLEQVLSGVLGKGVEVGVASSYEALAVDLLAGRADAAWCPPFTCARVEAMGVRVLVRAVRHGSASYRAALLTRAGAGLSLSQLPGKKAIWVDRDSVAGYLLPKAYLKANGLDGNKIFLREEFAGSYQQALEAVLQGRADVTACFAPAEGSALEGVGEVLPGKVDAFAVLGTTDPAPNDGVVVGISMPEAMGEQLARGLIGMAESADGRTLLQDVFHAEHFEPAPRLSYRALYRVALASV